MVYLVPSKPDPKPSKGFHQYYSFYFDRTQRIVRWIRTGKVKCPVTLPVRSFVLPKACLTGWPYAVSLMSILLAHEFGHYLMSRYHKTPATLPYFIPLPLPPLGTMGAAIIMQGTPKNKRVLFDIGVAGPLAGIVVAIPVLLFGLSLSHLEVIKPIAGSYQEGNSLLYLLAKYVIFGKLLPAPAKLARRNPFMYWLKYFFTRPSLTRSAPPMYSFRRWPSLAGLDYWSLPLTLIPAGTLDGGHVVYSWFGEKAAKGFPYILLFLFALGIFLERLVDLGRTFTLARTRTR